MIGSVILSLPRLLVDALQHACVAISGKVPGLYELTPAMDPRNLLPVELSETEVGEIELTLSLLSREGEEHYYGTLTLRQMRTLWQRVWTEEVSESWPRSGTDLGDELRELRHTADELTARSRELRQQASGMTEEVRAIREDLQQQREAKESERL